MMKITCSLVVVALLSLTVNAWSDDRALYAELENNGASVQRNLSRKDRPVVFIRYNIRQITPAGLDALKAIEDLPAIEFRGSGDTELTTEMLNGLRGKDSLKRLTVSYAKISDETAKVLGSLKSLDALEFQAHIEISPQGFHEIFNLKNLRELMLSDRLVNDDVIDDLKNFNRLKVLTLRSLFVSDEGIVALRQIPNLTTLRIFAGERVSLDGLRLLATMRLKQLDVTYFNASLAGLKELRKSDNLQKLRLVDARRVTDEWIPVFAEMTDLTELEIVGGKLTKGGLKELKSSLSRCKVTLVDF